MKNNVRKIKFKGEDFILVTSTGTDGAIAKEEAYRHGEVSFAHLHPSGRINRFGSIIGSVSDIEFGEYIEVEIADGAFDNLLSA